VTITPSLEQVGCGTFQDTVHLFVTDAHGQSANAEPVTITIDRECIQ
jgi:hypothetical protein